MHTLQAIKDRRSVKHFDQDYVLSDEEERILMDAIRKSPTSFNIQNWRILIVKDPAQRKKLREAAWGQAQVEEASHLFIFCADLKAWDKDPHRYWEEAPKDVQDYLVPKIQSFYAPHDCMQRDEAMRSIGIASQSMMLAAKSMGYDTCPMIGFDPDDVAKIINLPDDHVIGLIVTVGKAAKPPRSKGGYIPDEEVFFTDSF